jgi:acyl phosphate:glycerol-3-phosphate acyltransferase
LPKPALIAAISYLLGSIPFGYLLVRIFCGEDVRRSGSGNIGATNVSRKSPVLGGLTLLLDACKGSAAVLLAHKISGGIWGSPKPYQAMALAGMFAVVGHIFPLWLRFRGGKGVATGLGSFAVIAPRAVLIAVCIFIVVVLVFRYVSLGSIIAVGAFPLLALPGAVHRGNQSALGFVAATSLLIIASHHENISRLLAGTENRIRAKRA